MSTTQKTPKKPLLSKVAAPTNSKITRNFNINVNKDEPDLNDFLLSFSLFNRRPSKITLYSDFNPDVFWKILTDTYKVVKKNIFANTEIYPTIDNSFLANHRYSIELSKNIVITFLELDKMPDEESGYITNVTVYYDNSNIDMNSIFSVITPAMIVHHQNDDSPNISMIKYNNNSMLDLEPLPIVEENIIKCDNKAFKNYYNDDITKEVNNIIKSFNSNNKGLNVFYGDRGLGKTTFLLSLMEKITRKIIYIPNNLVDSVINNPEFFSILKRFNGLIVIDDSEIYSSNMMRSDSFNSYISQLVDGIQSNAINVQVLLIYNETKPSYDKNLNNVLQVIEFTALDTTKSNKLGNLLSNENTYNTPTKLVDIIKDNKVTKKSSLGYE